MAHFDNISHSFEAESIVLVHRRNKFSQFRADNGLHQSLRKNRLNTKCLSHILCASSDPSQGETPRTLEGRPIALQLTN
jgi:hypothetical protein